MADNILEGTYHGKLYLPSGYTHAGETFVNIPLHDMLVDPDDPDDDTVIPNTECAALYKEHVEVVGQSQKTISFNTQHIIRGYQIDFEWEYGYASKEFYKNTVLYLLRLSTLNLKLRLQPHTDNDFQCIVKINPVKSKWDYLGPNLLIGYTGSLYFDGVGLFKYLPDRSLVLPTWRDRDGVIPDDVPIWTDRDDPVQDEGWSGKPTIKVS